tara:strand:+ start:121 stop:624 length:504 start_codon:yes stop_codon:yes gene_type:complete
MKDETITKQRAGELLSPDFTDKIFTNGVTKLCGACKAGDHPHPAPAEYEVKGMQTSETGKRTPFRIYLCTPHIEGMGEFETDRFEIRTEEWKTGMLIPEDRANELVREFTGYNTFRNLCRNYPDLTYRLDVWGRGEKYWRHKQLCKFYHQATGVPPYAPVIKLQEAA